MASWLKSLIIAIAITLTASNPVWASGYEGDSDEFVSRAQPDIDLDQYESGSLGVLLPTYPRVFLYPAWRAILLGKDALQNEKREAGALGKACCLYLSGWINEKDLNTPQAQWLNARATVTSIAPRMKLEMYRKTKPGEWGAFLNCSDSSYLFAQSTLQEISKRPDATPARLKDWVAAQDAVFEFCGYLRGDVRYSWEKEITPPPDIPNPLSSEENKFWKQLREYQIAAANFYSGDFDKAQELFHAIGKDETHPMHDWGDYLALRASIRQATLSETGGPGPQGNLEEMANKILQNPALSKVHPHANASLRLIKSRLSPDERLEELSAILNDWKKNPHIDDALADWRFLANNILDRYYPHIGEYPEIESMRQKYEYFDWMRTIQHCDGTLSVNNDTGTCEAERRHALDKWRSSLKAKRPEARTWLVAVLMTTDHVDEDVIAQVKKVPESAPEYLTVQYFLVKAMRLTDLRDQARQIADLQLKKPFMSRSALNLFLQARFSLATNLPDAAHYLTRSVAVRINSDTKEIKSVEETRTRLGTDSEDWLNTHLAVIDLLKLAGMEVLPQTLRTKIAVAAWVRADLLNKSELAKQAAAAVAKLEPSLANLANSYLNEKNALERKHLLLLSGIMGDQIVPTIYWRDSSEAPYLHEIPYIDEKEEDAIASMWCSFKGNTKLINDDENFLDSTDPKTRDSEMISLAELGSATSYFGKHVLAYSKIHPNDPQIPWLLHVVVISTRGSCVDADNGEISRRAFTLLHRKYGATEWAEKTPYWY